MSVPTVCYLVTTRNDCFCPEKTVVFEMSERQAQRAKLMHDKINGCNHSVVKCIIMPEETFNELCPDWVSSDDRDEPKLMPLEKPLVIDAIRCRLRQDIELAPNAHTIPDNELRLLLNVVDAARECVRNWRPNAAERAQGSGASRVNIAEDQLIDAVREELDAHSE